MLKTMTLSLALFAGLSGPAFAISGLADVPSTWPKDGAFDTQRDEVVTKDNGGTDIATPVIETKKDE